MSRANRPNFRGNGVVSRGARGGEFDGDRIGIGRGVEPRVEIGNGNVGGQVGEEFGCSWRLY